MFDLFEFDDRPAATSTDTPRSRWFSHWDGPVGEPAEEVSLGWRYADSAVIVCTSGRSYDQSDARARGAYLALGSVDLRKPDQQTADAADIFREIDRIGSTPQLWHEGPALFDGELIGEAAVFDGFMITYQRWAAGGAVFLAATALAPAECHIRVVLDWSPYGVDATTVVPMDALRRP